MDKGILVRSEIPLAFILFLNRATTARTMVQGRVKDPTTICANTV
jgi:hypothetical protein